MSVDLARLRLLAQEPPREAMSRRSGPPSMTDAVFDLKQENAALRRGLNEAITEIDLLHEQARHDELMHKEEIGHWQEQT